MHLSTNAVPAGACSGAASLSLRDRRLIWLVPSSLSAALCVALAIAVLRSAPHSALDWLLLVPFGLVTAWECIILWQLVIGFTLWACGSRGLSSLERRAAEIEPVSTGRSRTAVLIPIFEEDAAAVFSRVRIILRSLERTGTRADIDVHVLSDTRSDTVIAAEQREWARAVADWSSGLHFHHRSDNAGRKAGNIQAFLDGHGDVYDFAIVLDADSLMSGAAMRRLIRLMEENGRFGLLQTVSFAAGRETLFARIQQFAVRLYAPLALRGLHFWQGHEGSYWGHNAILRIAPFRDHCRLPVLSGKPPFGGEILCHDIVEGALMVRGGWEVHVLPHFDGTWEEMPTNALDLVSRERRWCQGNLQHVRVLAFPGLHAASRAHLLLGIAGYLMAPLWWAFIILGVVRVLSGDPDHYGVLALGLTETGSAAFALVGINIAFLLVPRVLNLVHAFCDARIRRSFGGGRRLLLGVAAEQIFGILFGPVFSLITSEFVVSVITGRNTGWTGQQRADREVPLRDALERHGLHVAAGLAFALVAWRVGGWYALWTAPLAAGLLLSPALTCLSSRLDLGRLSRRCGLFLTPDDLGLHPELLEQQMSGP